MARHCRAKVCDIEGCHPTAKAGRSGRAKRTGPRRRHPKGMRPAKLNPPSALTLLAGAAARYPFGSHVPRSCSTSFRLAAASQISLTTGLPLRCCSAPQLCCDSGHWRLVRMQHAPLAAGHLTLISACSDSLLPTPTAAIGSARSCTNSLSCKQLWTTLNFLSRRSSCSCTADSKSMKSFNPAFLSDFPM